MVSYNVPGHLIYVPVVLYIYIKIHVSKGTENEDKQLTNERKHD